MSAGTRRGQDQAGQTLCGLTWYGVVPVSAGGPPFPHPLVILQLSHQPRRAYALARPLASDSCQSGKVSAHHEVWPHGSILNGIETSGHWAAEPQKAVPSSLA